MVPSCLGMIHEHALFRHYTFKIIVSTHFWVAPEVLCPWHLHMATEPHAVSLRLAEYQQG
jgi:hypothetical protein